MSGPQTIKHRNPFIICCALVLLALSLSAPSRTLAQGVDNYEAERQRAFQLMDASKFTEAMPILEKLAAARPSDGKVIYALGFSVFASSQNIQNPEARKQARSRARSLLVRAKELGTSDQISESLISAMPPDGGEETSFSGNKEADAAMHEGEAAYTRGELDKAAASYARALRLDPKLYEAALFAGDMYFKIAFGEQDAAKKNLNVNKAAEWFTKAIAINPNREIAYRYWGDALLEVGKMDEARAKFIEAIIAEPYKQLSYAGLEKWAQKNNTPAGHLKIVIPPGALQVEGKTTNITVTDSPNGSANWMWYGITRAAWANGTFTKEFPNEKAYRHTLREESAALRAVAEAASKDLKSKKINSLEPSLANLVKLNDAGLIEAYVLFARADEGIALDYAAYREANRDKLRRYWNEFVIGNGN